MELRAGRVLLVEKAIGAAQESSGKSGGILTDLLWHPEDQALVERSRSLYRDVCRRTGDPSVARPLGMLTLAAGPDGETLAARTEDLSLRGVRHELIEGPAIARRFPALDRLPMAALGLFLPDDLSLNPPAYAQAEVDRAREAGLEVRFGCRVTDLSPAADGVALRAGGELLRARRVLLATGTWTGALLRPAGLDLPLLPYRVQLCSLELGAPAALPMVWDTATDVYLVPDGPQSVLAGDGTRLSPHDPDDYLEAGDDAFHADIATRVPALTSLGDTAGLRSSWAGLVGATPDRRPLLGQLAPNLYVACGDNGIGVMRGPALGELAARIALGEAQAPALRPDRLPCESFEIRPGFTLV